MHTLTFGLLYCNPTSSFVPVATDGPTPDARNDAACRRETLSLLQLTSLATPSPMPSNIVSSFQSVIGPRHRLVLDPLRVIAVRN